MTIFSRNELYWGRESQELLAKKHVAVFGLGGVGGFCAEMLARAGVGELTIVDFDKVTESNINRQLIALNSTVGMDKAALFELRLKDINPNLKINVINDFYTNKMNDALLENKPDEGTPHPSPLPLRLKCLRAKPLPPLTSVLSPHGRGRMPKLIKNWAREQSENLNTTKAQYDFIADAIDTMRPKISLLGWAYKSRIPMISSFGAGNRINPEDLYICDISKIEKKNSPFISNLVYQLGKKGITEGITVVTSREKPFSMEKVNSVEKVQTQAGEEVEFTKITPASTPFVASTSGIFMASFIVRELIK